MALRKSNETPIETTTTESAIPKPETSSGPERTIPKPETSQGPEMFEREEGDTVVVDESELKRDPGSAVVVANASPMALALKRPTGLDQAQNVIDSETLETMGIGAFPRVTVDQGGFSQDKVKHLGMKIKIELMSWNYVTLVTTGEKDNKEADKLIRSSYDGKNIVSEGCTVEEYLARLKAQGYEKASIKKYIEIYANLLWTEKGGPVAPDEVQLVQLSVSPQSAAQWQRFLLESRMKAARGIDVTGEVGIEAHRKTLGSNTFGVMHFGVKV